jgi:NADH dehydrogenase
MTDENTGNQLSKSLPRRRVVIIGGGFGGVSAAQELRKTALDVTLVDSRNHHVFQPLLYQVATAVLAPSDVCAPIRQIGRNCLNMTTFLGQATSVDLDAQNVAVIGAGGLRRNLPYDFLIVAAGMKPSYFGKDDFAPHAPALKSVADAERIRNRILSAFEAAELTEDLAERQRQLTFVLVGAGPTGVELSASIASVATQTLQSDFRRADPRNVSVLLIEGGPRVLASFDTKLSVAAHRRLEALGVIIMTGTRVDVVDAEGVIAEGNRIAAATVLWTAGVEPSPIIKALVTDKDDAGRACVGPRLQVPNRPEVFVVGDAAGFLEAKQQLPGVAQVAMQQGRYAGRMIKVSLSGGALPKPFKYRDKGSMAVIGKNFAVLQTARVRSAGFFPWLAWASVHIVFLPLLQNRLSVQAKWIWTYMTNQRESRLIGED